MPSIAIQLSAFKIDDSIVLHPVRVLDVAEEMADVSSDSVEQIDRAYWEGKSHAQSLATVDKIVSSLSSDGVDLRVT